MKSSTERKEALISFYRYANLRNKHKYGLMFVMPVDYELDLGLEVDFDSNQRICIDALWELCGVGKCNCN